MSAVEDVFTPEYKKVCMKIGELHIMVAKLKKQAAEMEGDIARATLHGLTLDTSAGWARQVEKALQSANDGHGQEDCRPPVS